MRRCCGRFVYVVAPRLPVDWDLGLEGEVHLQLVRVDHRVFWPTQREIEGHTEGIRRDLKRSEDLFDLGRWRRGSGDHFSIAPSIYQVIP